MPEDVLTTSFNGTKRNLLEFPDGSTLFEFVKKHIADHRESQIQADWRKITNLSNKDLSESSFERVCTEEYVWAVHVAGFNAKIVARKWTEILAAHRIVVSGEFQPCKYHKYDFETAIKPFGNRRKCYAVQTFRTWARDLGWSQFARRWLNDRNPSKIATLPGMGPNLAYHLARNTGNVNAVKPDLHLNRLADHYGYLCAADMCTQLNPDTPPAYTDLMFWYASVDHTTAPKKPQQPQSNT